MSTVRRRRNKEGATPASQPSGSKTNRPQSAGGFTSLDAAAGGDGTPVASAPGSPLGGLGRLGSRRRNPYTNGGEMGELTPATAVNGVGGGGDAGTILPSPPDDSVGMTGEGTLQNGAASTLGRQNTSLGLAVDHDNTYNGTYNVKMTPKYLFRQLYVMVPLMLLVCLIILVVNLGIHVSAYTKTRSEQASGEFIGSLSETATLIGFDHYRHPHSYDNEIQSSVVNRLEALRKESESVENGEVALDRIITVARDPTTVYVTQVLYAVAKELGPLTLQSTPDSGLAKYFEYSLALEYNVAQQRVTSHFQEDWHAWDEKTAVVIEGDLMLMTTLRDHLLKPWVPSTYIPGSKTDIDALTVAIESKTLPTSILPNRSFTVDDETKHVVETLLSFIRKHAGEIRGSTRVKSEIGVIVELSLAVSFVLIGLIVSFVLIRDQHKFLQRRVVLQQDFRLKSKGNVVVEMKTLNNLDALCDRLGVLSRTIPRSQHPNQAELNLQCAAVPLQRLRPFIPSYAFEGSHEAEILLGGNDEEYVLETIPRLNLNQKLKRNLATCLMYIDFSILNFVQVQRDARIAQKRREWEQTQRQQSEGSPTNGGGGQGGDGSPLDFDRSNSMSLGAVAGSAHNAHRLFGNLIMSTNSGSESGGGGGGAPGSPTGGIYQSTRSTAASGAAASASGSNQIPEFTVEDSEIYGPECFDKCYIVTQKVATHFQGTVLQVSGKGLLLGFQRAQVLGHKDRKGSTAAANILSPGTSPTSSPQPQNLSPGGEDDGDNDGEEDEEEEAESLAVHAAVGIQAILKEQVGEQFVVPISIASGTCVDGLLSTHMSKFYSVIGPSVGDLEALQRMSAKHDAGIMIDEKTNEVIGTEEFLTRPVDYLIVADERAATVPASSGGAATSSSPSPSSASSKPSGGTEASDEQKNKQQANATSGQAPSNNNTNNNNSKTKGVSGEKDSASTAFAQSQVQPLEGATSIVYHVVLERPNKSVPDRDRVLREQTALAEQLGQWEEAFNLYLGAKKNPTVEKVEEAYRALEAYRNLHLADLHLTTGGSVNQMQGTSGGVIGDQGNEGQGIARLASLSGGGSTNGGGGKEVDDRPYWHAMKWVKQTLTDMGVPLVQDGDE